VKEVVSVGKSTATETYSSNTDQCPTRPHHHSTGSCLPNEDETQSNGTSDVDPDDLMRPLSVKNGQSKLTKLLNEIIISKKRKLNDQAPSWYLKSENKRLRRT
jgi:hypothetical protein